MEYLVWAMFAKNSKNLVQRDPSAAVKCLFNPGGGGGGGLSILSLHILPLPAKPCVSQLLPPPTATTAVSRDKSQPCRSLVILCPCQCISTQRPCTQSQPGRALTEPTLLPVSAARTSPDCSQPELLPQPEPSLPSLE